MDQIDTDSWDTRILAWLARTVFHRRRWFIYPQLALSVLCIIYTVNFLRFDTSRNDLVGSDKKYHQIFLQFRKEFPTEDDIVVVVESETPEKNRQYVERLAAKLGAETNLFKNVFFRRDLTMLGSKALLFVPEKDLTGLKEKLQVFQPFVERFSKTTNLVSLFDMINTQFRTAKQERNAQNESLMKALPALERIINQATFSLEQPGTPPSPGVMALFNESTEAEKEMYITFGNGQFYLVTAQPAVKGKAGAAIDRLRELMEATREEVPGVNIGATGESVLERDEMAQSQKDTMVASIASLMICALIFIYGYHSTGRPLKATLCLLVGLAYTMAFTTLVVGHLNILTITFAPILIGLAIDFGVHLVTRYEEELRHGRTPRFAMTKALVFTGKGIFTGAFTTAGAFLAMWFTDFKGIQEMGLICGGGLVVCLIPMMTLLPALLLGGKQNELDHQNPDEKDPLSFREKLENVWLSRPKIVMVIALALCALSAARFHRIEFDYNLLNMQSADLPAVAYEEKLIHATSPNAADTNAPGRSVLFAAVVATNLTEATRLEARLRELSTVSEVDSLAKYLVEEQSGKLHLIREIKDQLAPVQFATPDPAPVNLDEFSRTLFSTGGYLGLAHEATATNDPPLAAQFVSLSDSMSTLRREMQRGNDTERATHAAKLGEFQQALFNDLRHTFETLREQDASEKLRVADLAPSLRERFVGLTGKYLLQVYPKENVWERKHQEKFVAELRTVAPEVTGTLVQLLEYTTLLKNSYQTAALYSLAAIVVLVLIHFRNLRSVLLTLLPVVVGCVWLAGIMGWCGIMFNPANIMTLPLIIGIGVTNGIHILNRFAEEQTPHVLAKSTGKAVLVSGLTTIAGFGSLALAKHRGIESLGWVMATGVATCMIAGLTVLPALLNLLRRGKK